MAAPQDVKPNLYHRAPALVFVIALAGMVLHLATGWRYGLFRDEFYYLACANHLDWGFVDHPPLSIVVLAGVRALLGDSLFAVRLVPALLFGLLVWLAACLARELGGGRFAESLAALSVAVAPIYLALTGFYSMNAFDLVFWAAALLLLARLVRTDDARLWRPLGLVIGLGLLNKISLLFFAFGLAVAVLATPLRRHLKRRELWEGMFLALLLFSPYVLWQIGHGWATLEFMRNVTRYKNVALSPLAFAAAQLTDLHPLNAPLWILGLAWLLVGRTGRRFRALGIVFVATFVVLAVQNSKPYYLGPAFPVLLAAGALVVEGLSEAPRWRWVRPALLCCWRRAAPSRPLSRFRCFPSRRSSVTSARSASRPRPARRAASVPSRSTLPTVSAGTSSPVRWRASTARCRQRRAPTRRS